MSTAIIDGHNDFAWHARTARSSSIAGFDTGIANFHTDLPRLRAGGVGGQFWSVFTETDLVGDAAVRYTLDQIDCVHRLIDAYPNDLAFAWSSSDIRAAWRRGAIASLLGAEGGHAIANSLAVLRNYRRLGVRYLTLTHNRANDWADSATDEPRHHGLTEFGREVIAAMNELGMLVDLAHVAETTMNDALAESRAPVMVSHSCCRGVTNHPRNVPDAVLRRIADGGGIVMIAFVPPFLASATAAGAQPHTTIDDVVRHLEHARNVAGIDHIGLGSDFDGYHTFPEGLSDVAGFATLIAALTARGWSADDLDKLRGENVLRVLDDADAAATQRPVPLRTG